MSLKRRKRSEVKLREGAEGSGCGELDGDAEA